MEFVETFSAIPDLQVFKDYVEKYPKANNGVENLEDCYNRFGALNFELLVKDNFLGVERDLDNNIVPFKTIVSHDDKNYREIKYG